MTFLADENFPRPALLALRKAGWDAPPPGAVAFDLKCGG
jgi:hypothetical protein